MRTKNIFLTLVATALTIGASAQNELQRQVDVTRAYEPSVQNFLKLGVMPDMADTSQMRPEFSYEITPRPLVYGFAVNPLNPARFNTVENRESYPLYLKIGAGYPLQSVFDLRYAKALSDRTNFGAYASHYGEYGKIKNDMDIKEKAFNTDNRAGAFIDHKISNDLILNGELGYDFRNVTRYGYFDGGQGLPSWFDTSKDALGQFYHDVKADVAVGNTFTDRGKFNFRVHAGGDYFADRFKYDQLAWKAGVLFGFGMGYDGNLQLRANFRSTDGMNNLKDYSNQILTAGAQYYFDNGMFRFSLGADYAYDKIEEGKSHVLPQFNLAFDLADGKITPFVDLRSEITDNSYGELAKLNPYLFSGVSTLNTKSYDGRAGIKGALGGSFKYKVYGGYRALKDTYYWVNDYTAPNLGNVFGVITDDLNVIQAGVEIEANIARALTLYGAFNYYDYDPDQEEEAWGMPEFKSNIALTYNHRNQLYLTLGATLTGDRKVPDYYRMDIGPSGRTLKSTVDLQLGVDYFINKRFGVFVNLNNLLNQDLYEFSNYRGLGINAMAGVKLTF